MSISLLNAVPQTPENALISIAQNSNMGTGYLEKMQKHVEQNPNIDINATDDRGRTAILWAVVNYNPAMVRYLVERGASVNVPDPDFGRMLIDQVDFMATNDPDLMHFEPFRQIREYLHLAKDYESAGAANTIAEFLSTLMPTQLDDIYMIAFQQNRTTDLIKFHKLNPKRYSWEFMLGSAAQMDLSEPVKFILGQMGMSLSEMEYILADKVTKKSESKRLNELRSIFQEAQKNDRNNFGRAMVRYYLELRKLKYGFKKTPIPQEIATIINQFQE